MTLITSSKGETRDIDLSPGLIVAYEREHDYNFSKALRKGEDLSLSDLDIFVQFMGFQGLQDWVDQGYTIAQITDVLDGCRWMGFTGSEKAQ